MFRSSKRGVAVLKKNEFMPVVLLPRKELGQLLNGIRRGAVGVNGNTSEGSGGAARFCLVIDDWTEALKEPAMACFGRSGTSWTYTTKMVMGLLTGQDEVGYHR